MTSPVTRRTRPQVQALIIYCTYTQTSGDKLFRSIVNTHEVKCKPSANRASPELSFCAWRATLTEALVTTRAHRVGFLTLQADHATALRGECTISRCTPIEMRVELDKRHLHVANWASHQRVAFKPCVHRGICSRSGGSEAGSGGRASSVRATQRDFSALRSLPSTSWKIWRICG